MCEQWFLWEPGLRGCAMQGERSLWFGREASHGPFKGSLGAPGRGLPALLWVCDTAPPGQTSD